MGAWPARFSAADFLTPPELAGLALARSGAGRIGGVRLKLAACPEGTRLTEVYQQVPLRVLPPFRLGPGQPALVYLLNPTAGLLDGDGQKVEVEAGAGSRAVVTGQSATRIHPGVLGFCTQQWHVRVEAGAVLVVLPGPAIPFRGCRYYQRVEVDLAEGGTLLWGDVWLPGRYGRDAPAERFAFETMVQELTVHRAGRLVFRDRFCWQGPWDEATARWHFGGSVATASLFVTGAVPEPERPAGCPVQTAWFPTAAGDTCLRFQGTAEAVTGALVETALKTAALRADSAGLDPWLLGRHDLGPNHWFSRWAPREAGGLGVVSGDPRRRPGTEEPMVVE